MKAISVIDCAKMYKIEKYLRESLIIKLNDCFCNICYIYLFEMEFMSNISETVFLNNNSCCVFYFIPISSTFFRNKAEKTTFFQFFPVSSRCPGRNRFLPEETQPCHCEQTNSLLLRDRVTTVCGESNETLVKKIVSNFTTEKKIVCF